MSLKFGDRVKETTATTGTGTYTLAGAVSGFQAFGSALSNSDSCYYAITDVSGNWEVGLGTYTASGTTLARTVVLASSNSGSAVSWSSGTKTIWLDTAAATQYGNYNVKAYGAVGDGSTDDTTAIQRALDAAAGAGGGVVFFPEATYVVSNITIDSYVEIRGAGRGTLLQGKTSSSGYMIALTTPSTSQQTAIRSITLKPNTGTLGGIKLDNTSFGTSIDPLHILDDVVVLNAGGDAFHFDNSMRELQVKGCYAHYSGGYGFYIGAGCTDGRFIGCTTGPSTNHGYEIIGNNNNFVACKAFYAGYNGSTWGTTQVGFHLNATSYSTFTSCSAQQNALHGWNIVSCFRTTITGCESDTNSAGTTGGVGFNTDGNTYCVLASNVGANNGGLSPGNQAYGIQVANTQTGTLFTGNAVTGSSGDFGYVSGFGYVLISAAIVDFTGIPTKINDVTQFALAGATSGSTTFTPAATASGTLTVPSATDTLVARATTDTLTNKTLDGTSTGNTINNALTLKTKQQNNVSNSAITGTRIETGWGVFAQGSASNKSETVTFNTAFTSAPIVTISFNGDQTGGSIAYGNGGNTVKGPVAIKAYGASTTAFTAHAHTSDGTSWGATDNVYYTWIAIGN